MNLIGQVLTEQREWARRNNLRLSPDEHLTVTADALLTGRMDRDTEAELGAGAGGELERLTSLRSSSALAVNVFAPWRRNPGQLARVLGGSEASTWLRFEATFPTGLRGTPPHLDVLIGGSTPVLAIESKFLELYSPAKNRFASSYFEMPGLWIELGRCLRLAEGVHSGSVVFEWLDVAQLLKHTLGLSKSGSEYRLLLLWYRIDDPVADAIDREIERFQDAVGGEVAFEAITYQDLFARLSALDEPTPGYLDYLGDRYFGETDG